MKTSQEIVKSIDIRLRELNDEIKALDAARLALNARELQESRPPASAPTPRKRRRTSSRPGTRRALKAVPADHLESLLSRNGGSTTSALAEQTGGDRDQVLTLLRELETAGRVRRTGQRRATRWHAITDEDRIRARAAELEATRKRAA
jgi:hypothetical protein